MEGTGDNPYSDLRGKVSYERKSSLVDRLVGVYQKFDVITPSLRGKNPKIEFVGSDTRQLDSVVIRGESEFCDRIFRNLLLIKSKSETAWKVIQRGRMRIRQAAISGTRAEVKEREILVGEDIFTHWKDENENYLAGAIGHEANHIDRFRRNLPSYGFRGEIAAVKFQVATLIDIGASRQLIESADWHRQRLESPFRHHRKEPGAQWWKDME